jgi:hypothetical protein
MHALLVGTTFFASLFTLHLSGFRLLGINAHPLAFLIWMQIFVLTLIGTLGLGVFGLPMAYGADAAISEETRSEVIFLTFWSVIVFFLGLAGLFGLKVLRPLNYQVREDDSELLSKLTIISVIIIFVKLVLVSEIPLLLVLSGDLLAATEAKIRILTKQTGVTLFGFNYIVRSFPSYIYIASVLVYVSDKKNKRFRNLFMVNLFLAAIDSLYDVQKQAIVFLALASFWIFYIQKGNFMALLKGGAIASVLAGSMFVLTLDYSSGQAILDDTANRIFLAQTEGMFFIRELIDPAIKYMWLGFPLAGLFGLEQLDPAAEVIPILFPTVGDTWLNSNTYYIAHAWTIFGDWAVLLGPFFVLINIVVVLLVAQPLIKTGSVIYYAVIFWLLIKMPIVNIFTEFLWMKVVLDALINIAFVSFLIFLFKPKLRTG